MDIGVLSCENVSFLLGGTWKLFALFIYVVLAHRKLLPKLRERKNNFALNLLEETKNGKEEGILRILSLETFQRCQRDLSMQEEEDQLLQPLRCHYLHTFHLADC